MSAKTDAQTNPASAINPAAPWRLTRLSLLPDYRLSVTFVDGTEGMADLSALIHGENPGIYGALADPLLFAKARLEFGAVMWPNGADIDPDWMHEEIKKNGVWKAG